MNIRWYPVAWPRIDRAVIAGVLLMVSVSFTSCDRLRTPQQLLVEPDSRDNPRLVARAKELYLRNCAICHTETGQGEGRYFASDLEPKPTDLTLQSGCTPAFARVMGYQETSIGESVVLR